MVKKNLSLLILLGNMIFSSLAFAQGIPQVAGPIKTGPTYVSGNITKDTTWGLGGSPFIITGNVTVNPAVKLTIQPGVEIKFDAFYQLRIDGTLDAQGAEGNLIVFTSNRGTPAPQDWSDIYFSPTSRNNIVRYAQIEYGKYGLNCDTVAVTIENNVIQNNYFGIFVQRGSASTITNNTITNNTEHEIHVENSSPRITNNRIISTTNGRYGVVLHGTSGSPSKAVVTDNAIYGHSQYNLYANSTSGDLSWVTINAQKNWWGTVDTKQISAKIYDYNEGTSYPVVNFSHYLDSEGGNPTAGEVVSGPIGTNKSWTRAKSPYTVVGNITIEPAVTLTIDSGVRVQFDANYQIQVDGILSAIGTADDIITFTSNQLNPAAKNWSQIYFSPTSGNSVVKYSKIEYANYAFSIQGVSPIVEDNIIQNSFYGMYIQNTNTSRIANNTITGNSERGIYVRSGASPTITNNTITNNGLYGVVVHGTSGTPSRPVINYNSIYGHTTQDLHANSESGDQSSLRLDAQYNWLGTTDTKGISNKTYDYTDNENAPVINFSHFLDSEGGNPLPVVVASGFIDRNTTLVQGEDVIIVGNTTVNDNVTLTIQPGVFVGFDNNYNLTVKSNATLLAQGTETEMITFTSNRAPINKGDWQYILLSNSSIVSYANVEYSDSGLRFDNASPIVQNCMIKNNNYGIYMLNGTGANITGNKIIRNNYGIYIYPTQSDPSKPSINNNFIYNNASLNVYASGHQNFSGRTINAKNNWWGSADPVVIASTIYDRNDNANSPLVDFDPFKTESETIVISDISISPIFFSAFSGEATDINYTINKDAVVTLNIYNYMTKHPLRALVERQSRTVGVHTESWDGKNDAGNILPPDVYYFTIKAEDADQRFGEYDPVYVPGTTNIEPGSTVEPANVDPYKGEVATVSYGLTVPAWATIKVGLSGGGSSDRILVNNQPRDVTNTDFWDGRNDGGNIAGSGTYVVYGFDLNILPDNASVIQSDARIEELKADPYVIYAGQGDVTEITYIFSHDAVVSLEILSPGSNKVRTLVDKEAKTAGTYTIAWDGQDDFGRAVSEEGHYKIKLSLFDQYGRIMTDRYSNVTVFK